MYSWADVFISCGQAATSNAGDATDDADLEQFGNSLVLHVLQHRINRTIVHAPNLIALANLIAWSETISIPPQDVTNNPTEPAQNQVAVHQEKFTESSQQFNDLFANLIACSETISIPPQDVTSNHQQDAIQQNPHR